MPDETEESPLPFPVVPRLVFAVFPPGPIVPLAVNSDPEFPALLELVTVMLPLEPLTRPEKLPDAEAPPELEEVFPDASSVLPLPPDVGGGVIVGGGVTVAVGPPPVGLEIGGGSGAPAVGVTDVAATETLAMDVVVNAVGPAGAVGIWS